MIRKTLFWISLAIFWGATPLSLFGQEVPFFVAVAKKDTVFILITRAPERGIGCNIYRKGPAPYTDKNFEKLNEVPIRGIRDPYQAREILGEDYNWVAKAVRSENELQTLRRIRSSEFAGSILSMLNLKVAEVLGRLYVDHNLKLGAEYIYKIVFVDRRGEEQEDGAEQRLTIVEKIPRPPKTVRTEVGDGKVTVNWDYAAWKGDYTDLVICFNVYRKKTGEKGFQRANEEIILRMKSAELMHTDVWLENGVAYSYYVTSVDMIGRESPPSSTVVAVPEDDIPPAIPSDLVAIPKEGKIQLSWGMNLELDLSHYDVFRSLGLNRKFVKINPAPVLGGQPYFLDESVDSGTLYFYRVSAVDKSGNESKRSNAISGLPEDKTPPEPPTNLTWKTEGTFLNLTWQSSESEDVAGYYVYRGETRDIFPRLLKKPLEKEVTWFRDTGYGGKGLKPGGVYYVGVSAVDISYNESEKTVIQVTLPDHQPPQRPASLIAELLENGSVRINWGASLSLDVTHYRLYRAQGAEAAQLLKETEKHPRSYLDEEVQKGFSYAYSVTAVDSAGNESERAPPYTVDVRDGTPPSSPRNVRACLTAEGVEIVWGRVVDEDFAGYNVYRSDLPTGVFEKLNDALLKERRYLDRGGKPEHWYRVHAVDTSGNQSRLKKSVQPRKCGG